MAAHGTISQTQIFSAGTTVLVILATQLYGWNVHVWDLTLDKMVTGRKVRDLQSSCPDRRLTCIGIHGWSNPLRSCFQFRQDVYPNLVFPHCSGEVAVPEACLGNLRVGLRGLHCLPYCTLGTMHVSSVSHPSMVALTLADLSAVIGR